MPASNHPVEHHYSRGDLLARFERALIAAGKDPLAFSACDISSADHFHTGGRASTAELARLAGLHHDHIVLDVGGGIGGPARLLAAEFGCHVTVLDFTREFIDVGCHLTSRTGLSDRVSFLHGDALALPFPPASFDIVLSQHASMNIADKPQLYSQVYRVLKPGGSFAFHDVMAGPVQPIHFPVPWSATPDTSFLSSPAGARAELARLGFRELAWRDETRAAHAFFQQRAAQQSSPDPLSVRLLLGEKFPAMFENLARNFAEERLAAVMAVLRK